jgi:hypothetical protein
MSSSSLSLQLFQIQQGGVRAEGGADELVELHLARYPFGNGSRTNSR